MKVALLGHTGFLGRNLQAQCQQVGLECVGASRSVGIDLREVGQATDFLAAVQPDVILHCAAHVGSFHYVTAHASAVVLDNSRLVLAVYEAMARVCPQAVIIHPLANCVYPATAELFRDEAWQDGPLHRTVLPFASTRRLAWAVGESFAISHGIQSRYLLVPNMYGPYDSPDPNQTAALDALIVRFITAQRAGQPSVTVWGTGNAIREWIFAPDLAQVMLAVARYPHLAGLAEPLNVAQQTGLSIRELVDIIRRAVGYTGAVEWDTSKPDGAPVKVMENTRFRQVFPDFEFTNFQQGIENTIQYYRSILH